MVSGSVQLLSNRRISEGSTWQFSFRTVQNYGGTNTWRFTFPLGFTSLAAACDIVGYIGQNPEAVVSYDQRTVSCKNVAQAISNTATLSARVINMVNPNYAGDFSGFVIQVMNGDSPIVQEKISFQATQTIQPGLLSVAVVPENRFKASLNVSYAFYINLRNPVDDHGQLRIAFTPQWTLINANCTPISGFALAAGRNLTCRLSTD
jgi:hypothetical protein